MAGALVHAQPMAAHCAGHAMHQLHDDSIHHDSAGSDKGCCGDSGCATGACTNLCASAPALTSTLFSGVQLTPAHPAAAPLAALRVMRRTFGVFRPPI
jgi:hypothetical protein